MQIRLFSDNTVDVDLTGVATALGVLTPSIQWTEGISKFSIRNTKVSNPKTYDTFSASIQRELKDDDFSFLFTEKPYDNNYFWDSPSNKTTIVSFYGWDHLTDLPRNNGVAYFSVALLIRALGIGQRHFGKNTGCINDFWQDKTGIDSGMRAAYLCGSCLNLGRYSAKSPHAKILKELQAVLDTLSQASRSNEDVFHFWKRVQRPTTAPSFDVFLCHNSKDKDAIRPLNRKLKALRINTWLDEEQLPPGRAWQELLEKQIESISTAAVFVGSSGTGPWQDMEIRAFLSEFVNRRCPVIPVILEGCKTVPQLPLFMRQFTWVDFRRPTPPPFEQLIWGITGTRPSAN